MQAAQPRRLVLFGGSIAARSLLLAAVFALAAGVLAAVDRQPDAVEARWPTEADTLDVAGWTADAASVEAANGNHYVTRNYASPGARAQVSITTGTEAKRVYRAGAAIPFQGAGYTVDQAPPSMVPDSSGYEAVTVRREGELGLLLYAYGERRGLVGNGPLGWTLVTLDSILGRSNDYYLLRVYAPLSSPDPAAAGAVLQLADTLFARVAAWYGA